VLGEAPPSFITVGSWVGGDRDGNPNVTAEVMATALRRQARVALGAYLEAVHHLGADLSISAGLAEVSEAVLALAAAAHDPSPHRADEPYRQALTGIYARLAASYQTLVGEAPPRRAAAAEPLPRSGGVEGRFAGGPRLADRPPWASVRQWAVARSHPRRGLLRLSPRHPGHAPERGGA
jgi:phosphoenolpyruvate carboxylase